MKRYAPLVVTLTLACLGCGSSDSPDDAAAPDATVATPAQDTADSPAPAADSMPVVPPAPPPLFPRGLVTNLPGATPGFVLFSPLLSNMTYLVDNEGQVVHTWSTSYSPGGGQYLLPNGNLLRPGRDPDMAGFRAGGTGGILQELDWSGEVVWEWRLSEAGRVLHHDVEPLPNGNILAIAWEAKSAEEARRAGRRADGTPEQGLWPDWVLEIEPIRPDGAKIVWEWHVWDHLVQDTEPGAPNHADPAVHPERLDINAGAGAAEVGAEELAMLQALGYVPEDATPEDLDSDFLHVNAIDYHPRLDQIALSVPELGEVWVIDHGTTTEAAAGSSGDLLYRWGNPAAYGRGDAAAQRFFYQHDVRWIPDGWEGAGNLTVFNNGRDRPAGAWSSVDEWTPSLDGDGAYELTDGQAFGPADLHWRHVAVEPTDFFAPFISGAARLENGNTLVCSGTGGQLFEVTRDGRRVWEYRSPFSGDVRNADGTAPQPGLDENPYAVFRGARIPLDHPAVADRDLSPLDPQPKWFDSRKSDSGV